MTDRDVPLNEAGARLRLSQIEDPAIRGLIGVAFGAAFVQLMRPVGMPQADWENRLPSAPFDLDFFVRTLSVALGDREVVARILNGTAPEIATGWWDAEDTTE